MYIVACCSSAGGSDICGCMSPIILLVGEVFAVACIASTSTVGVNFVVACCVYTVKTARLVLHLNTVAIESVRYLPNKNTTTDTNATASFPC